MNWKSCCCSVAKLCLTLQPHVLQHARLPCHSPSPGVAQTHVHWVSDANQHVILCHPLLLLPSIFPNIRVFSMSQLFAAASQRIGASTSASVLSMNIQGWSPLGLTGMICLLSKGLSRIFSNTTAILWVSFGGRWQLSSPSELLSLFSFCTIQIWMLWSHVLNTGQLPAFCIWEYSDDQTHILCRTLRLLTPQTPHFWKCFMTLCFCFSFRDMVWSLLAFDVKCPTCNPFRLRENWEIGSILCSGCGPYEVMTTFYRDICSAFPIEMGRRTAAECSTGAESTWNCLWGIAENVAMVCISWAQGGEVLRAGGGGREEMKASVHIYAEGKVKGANKWQKL